MKFPILIQDEQKACGVYCIAMILRYYGYKEEIKEIKRRTRLSLKGVSILGVIECFKSYDIEAKAYEIHLNDLNQYFNKPCILLCDNNGLGHFVVLYEIKDDIYTIGDPALGLIKCKKEELNHYTSRCIMISHAGDIKVSKKNTYISYIISLFFTYKTIIVSIIKKGILISLLGYISSLFFKLVIDYMNKDSSLFIVSSGIIMYCICEIIKGFIYYIKSLDINNLHSYIDDDLINDNIYKLIDYHNEYEDISYTHSELLSLFDLSEMTKYLIENIFTDGICIIVFMIGMYFINNMMFIIVFILFITILYISLKHLKTIKKIQKNYQESYYQYSSYLYTILKSIKLIHSYKLNHIYKNYYHNKSSQLIENRIKRDKKNNRLYYINHIIINLYLTIILYIGFNLYINNKITLGYLFMFYTLINYCITPLLNNIALYEDYQHMCFLYEKYKKYNNEYKENTNKIDARISSIKYDHIEYSYGYGIPIIQHLDWHIQHSVILTGKTGTGKSTLLKLLLGYDYNYVGDIYINEYELRSIDIHSLYERIIYIDEKPVFIEGSLYDNYLCDDIDRINELLDYFEIPELKRYDIELDIEGSSLSLGQRQTVSLIRALLADKDVYIFDEAFSHMDSKLRNKAYEYLNKTKDFHIYIIVDHQINLMNIDFDCVIMDEKRIKSKG